MVNACCVPNCSNRAKKGCKLSFHSFPVNDVVRKQWIHAVRRDVRKSAKNPTPLVINKHTKVCSEHFLETDYWYAGSLLKLRKNVVPSVFTWTKKTVKRDSTYLKRKTQFVTEENLPSSSKELFNEDAEINIEDSNLNPEKHILLPATEILIENHNLKSHIEILNEEIRSLKQAKSELEKSCEQQKSCKTIYKTIFSVENFRHSDEKILYYSGMQTFEIFSVAFKFILPSEDSSDILLYTGEKPKIKRNVPKLTAINQFFLTLMKLRKAFDYETLSDMFGVSKSTAAKIFISWINFMYLRLGSLNIWPHRDILLENTAARFKQEYPNVIGSIDCTEFFIETPSSMVRQSQCYSNYKGATTLKSLLMIDPNGAIIFVSALFTGSISDKKIISDSGYLSVVKKKVTTGELCEGDVILADKGFNVVALFEDINININIPTFRISGMQFNPEDVRKIRMIAKERIHVERAINRIKKYRILSNNIPVSLLGSINQIYTVCCLLTNFRYPLIKK